MLLAIDIGNTNTVFSVFKGEQQGQSWRMETQAGRSGDEYAALLHELFKIDSLDFSDVSHALISSVVPDANFQIEQFCTKYLSCASRFVSKDNAGISIALDRPDEVGADRLVNARAIVDFYQYPAVVIDFGTATTFDVINDQGHYAGGVIAPGIRLSVQALNRAAAKLPVVSIERPERTIGKTTKEAMQSGLFWGYLAMIEGILKNITEELGVKPFVLATGGLAHMFAQSTDVIDKVDEDLTLKGLHQIHKEQ